MTGKDEVAASAWPKRYTLVLLCFAAAFICYIDRVNISVASIAMQGQFGWNETQKGFVLASFFVGYIATQVVAGWLANRFGGKLTLGCAVLLWSAFTVLTPIAAATSFTFLLITRVALGLGEGAMFPAAYNLLGHWLPLSERTRGIAFMLSGIPLGTLFALTTTGPIVVALDWPAAFYIFGSAGGVWAFFWFRHAYDRPSLHPGLGQAENTLISSDGGDKSTAAVIPWRSFLSHRAFWAMVINHFCSNWTLYVLLSWLPTYFSRTLGSNLVNTGLLAAAPWLTMFLMVNVSGMIADRLVRIGMALTIIRKIMQSIGLLGPGLLLPLAQFVTGPLEAMLLMCAALGLSGFAWSGYAANPVDLAPRHAGVLLGISNTFGTIPGIVGVAITGWLVDVTGNFNSAFLLIGVLAVIGTTVWLMFSTARKIVE